MPPPNDYTSYSLFDVVGSPFYNVAETVSQLPFIRDTELNNWLQSDPSFQGIRNFQGNNPGGALAADFAGALVPFVGWGGALGRAGLSAPGIFGASNRAGLAAASMFPRSAPLAFAAGEAVRYAPLSAAITGLDTAAGKYENPWVEAPASFLAGNLLGVGFQAAGHAASPFIARHAPDIVSGAWNMVFEPSPQLQALYGFSNNVALKARNIARVPRAQEALDPTLEPQLRAGAIYDLLTSVREAKAAQAAGGAVSDQRLLEIDEDMLQGVYDTELRNIIYQTPEPAEQVFAFRPGENDARQVRGGITHALSFGPFKNGEVIREQLTGSAGSIRNPDTLTGQMELPNNWLQHAKYPGIMQTTLTEGTWMRRYLGLEPSAYGKHAVTLLRRTKSGKDQIWSARRDDDGFWLLSTQIPGEHVMSARARYPQTQSMDRNAQARAFLTFKTHRPDHFFPELRTAIDDPDGGVSWAIRDRIPRGASPFLDKTLDFENIYLNPRTIKAGYEAMMAGRGGKEKFIREMLRGPTFGQQIARFFDTYTAPTDQQLKYSPEGRGILSLYQALFDAADGRKSLTLFGSAAIPENMSPIAALFKSPDMQDSDALATLLRQAVKEDPNTLDIIRRFDKGRGLDLKSIENTAAGRWLKKALEANARDIEEINKAIGALRSVGATDARTIPSREAHFGLSRNWDGSVFYPIYKAGQTEPVAVVAGGNQSAAEAKARAWIAAEEASTSGAPGRHRIGQVFIAGETETIPNFIKESALNPGLLEPRAGMRGYEHEFEPYGHVDDLIKELEENYTRRWRYAASTIADALTGGKLNALRARDATAYNVVKTRIAQLKGQPGPIESRLNQIVDSVAAPLLGTRGASKIADGVNEFNFHMLHGMGYIGTPLLNLTSILQTHLPEGVNFATSNPQILRGMGYQIPVMGADGLPRPGFHNIPDPLGLLRGAFNRVMKPDDETREVFQALFNRKEMGTGLANEYTGQDRTIAVRMSEKVRGPEDAIWWLKYASSALMSKTEQISRTVSAGMALEAMAKFEAVNGVKFTMDQKIANALKYVRRTNYGYFVADRPQMFTTPLGALFGNQKTWMTNYLFMMGEYFGLAAKGNMWPLLMAMGTTTALGGVFAVPMIGAGIDAFTEFFADQDAKEYIYDRMGEGGNWVSYGLPGLLGISLQGNVAAPGSNLAHDAEFFGSVVAMTKAQQIGRFMGRAWDDQVTLGLNPLRDPILAAQFRQALTPRSIYRLWESATSNAISSAATGYPMVRDLTLGQRVLHGMGFRDVETAIQYSAFESMMKDKEEMNRRIGLFGEAYAQAALANDRAKMMELLQQAAVMGVDMNSIMRSAQVRMRNAGRDMFGRNFNEEQQAAYNSMLTAGGL